MKLARSESTVIDEINSLCVGTQYSFNGWVDNYENCKSKFKCNCKKHGDWITTAHRFLWSGKRCKKCAVEKASIRLRTPEEDRRREIVELCKDSPYHFVKWKGVYENSDSLFTCYCELHDLEWDLKVRHFIYSGTRCPKCAGFGYQKTAEGTLYALRSENGGLIKIGITNCLERRIKELVKNTPFNFFLVETIVADGKTVSEFEQMFHKEFESAKLTGFKGSTEWLKWTPEIQYWLKLLSS